MIVAVVVALIAIIVVVFFLVRGGGNKAEYEDLLGRITSSSSPSQVASYESELDTFESENPDLVDTDLTALVNACVEYNDAADEEYRYTEMISELEQLESSSVPQVASCASELLPGVETDYDDYLYWLEEEEAAAEEETVPSEVTSTPASTEFDLATSPMPVSGNGLGELSTIDGQPVFSFPADNVSDRSIVYFEVIVFCYDAEGNPITGTNGYNWEWKRDDTMTIPPGGQHIPSRDGYWPFNDHSNVAYVVPFVVFTRFDDGSTWGSELSTAEKIALGDQLQSEADAIMAAAL
ncbi:hypothetical protein LJC49_05385 [Ruminococcaceae bacterium OttesenSCG-928-I18]|nr:hypothetical protein [Ruminococcaceae bacterium OttesenSCG-928-I18]